MKVYCNPSYKHEKPYPVHSWNNPRVNWKSHTLYENELWYAVCKATCTLATFQRQNPCQNVWKVCPKASKPPVRTFMWKLMLHILNYCNSFGSGARIQMCKNLFISRNSLVLFIFQFSGRYDVLLIYLTLWRL